MRWISFEEELTKETSGSKAYHLHQLKKAGFEVPSSIVIPSDDLEAYQSASHHQQERFAKEVIGATGWSRYAVRSSALSEDTRNASQAGRYTSMGNVVPAELAEAMRQVLNDAQKKQGGSLGGFSLLIQEYIDAETYGIVFTRNPLGGPEMVKELWEGPPEELSGGEVLPDLQQTSWNELGNDDQTFADIEQHFGCPQDVECCWKSGQLIILQSRPISTIDQKMYQKILAVEKRIKTISPQKKLVKNEITETCPRPNTFMLSILRKLFSQDGAIQKAYKNFGISYQEGDIFSVIGNELYIDADKHLQCILPSHQFNVGRQQKELVFRGFGKMFQDISNTISISNISAEQSEQWLEKIQAALTSNTAQTYQDLLKNFFKDYELIFSVNILAQASFHRLERSLKKEPFNAVQILSSSPLPEEQVYPRPPLPQSPLGNGIDISDETPFLWHRPCQPPSRKVSSWWESLSAKQRERKLRYIAPARQFQQLREYARWLTVQHISMLRTHLRALQRELGWNEKNLIFFCSMQEIQAGKCDKKKALLRWEEFNSWNDLHLSDQIPIQEATKKKALRGLSKGIAVEKLVPIEDWSEADQGALLYTPQLTPSLMPYLEKVSGIVSEQGGMLSHAAILAREKGIPAISGLKAMHARSLYGKRITIDGARGMIKEHDIIDAKE